METRIMLMDFSRRERAPRLGAAAPRGRGGGGQETRLQARGGGGGTNGEEDGVVARDRADDFRQARGVDRPGERRGVGRRRADDDQATGDLDRQGELLDRLREPL